MRVRDLPFFWLFHMFSESRKQYRRVLSYLRTYPFASVDSSAKISGNIELAKEVKINYHVIIRGNIKIGKATFVNSYSVIASAPETFVHIGSFCSIANKCSFHAGNHPTRTPSTFKTTKGYYAEVFKNVKADSSSITIGSDVWVGANVTILSGVEIGHGAVIGAGAVVTKSIPPYAIAIGVPAKVIAYRFKPEVINWLVNLAWWDWSDEKMLTHKYFFEQDLSLLDDVEFENLKTEIS